MLINSHKQIFLRKHTEVFNTVRTKGIAATVDNYKAAIGAVPAKYKSGVEANTDQNERAIAAQTLYEARIAESIANKSRVKGLQKSSTEKWKRAAATKGAARIGAGMNAALPEFQSGMTEVLATIESVTIAERTADPEANVDGRVKPIVRALYDMKRR